MNKQSVIGLILLLAGVATATESAQVKVIGNRVSLRAAPELNAVLLGQAMNDDLFTLVDSSNPDWFGVIPPEEIDLWVAREFVRNGKVVPERLNVRAGPSLNYGTVGVLYRNDAVTTRGEKGEWVQIAPTERTVVWISRRYSVMIGTHPESVAVIHIEPAPKPEEPAVIIEPIVQTNAPVQLASEISGLSCQLKLDSDKKQGEKKHLTGTLKKSGEKLFKLVDTNAQDHMICYVRGNLEQLNKLKDKPVAITGEAFWVVRMNVPIVTPQKIQLLKL